MKPVIFIFVIVLIFGCSNNKTETIKEYYPNKKIFKEYTLDTSSNKRDTIEKTEYYPNGNIKVHGSYKNNLRDGLWEYYHPNGKLWSKGNFKEGKSEGIFTIYNEDGTLFMQSSYKNGKPDGKWIFYDKGKKKKEIIFANDSIIQETNY
jgi:antitoxin component YwqK of YwqJK toxin-antitoxin module